MRILDWIWRTTPTLWEPDKRVVKRWDRVLGGIEEPESAAWAAHMSLVTLHRLVVGSGNVENLRVLVSLQEEMARLMEGSVWEGRATHGWSWSDVARAVGGTRQAAQQRFGNEIYPPAK